MVLVVNVCAVVDVVSFVVEDCVSACVVVVRVVVVSCCSRLLQRLNSVIFGSPLVLVTGWKKYMSALRCQELNKLCSNGEL